MICMQRSWQHHYGHRLFILLTARPCSVWMCARMCENPCECVCVHSHTHPTPFSLLSDLLMLDWTSTLPFSYSFSHSSCLPTSLPPSTLHLSASQSAPLYSCPSPLHPLNPSPPTPRETQWFLVRELQLLNDIFRRERERKGEKERTRAIERKRIKRGGQNERGEMKRGGRGRRGGGEGGGGKGQIGLRKWQPMNEGCRREKRNRKKNRRKAEEENRDWEVVVVSCACVCVCEVRVGWGTAACQKQSDWDGEMNEEKEREQTAGRQWPDLKWNSAWTVCLEGDRGGDRVHGK